MTTHSGSRFEGAPHPVVSSLRQSAEVFDLVGDKFAASFTRSLITGAELDPSLYAHWARQQAERAAGYQGRAAA